MKGYFAVDLIVDKDDRMQIIDIHGYSDVVNFSKRAGYKPRKSRMHRFMEIAKRFSKGNGIVHIFHGDLYGEHHDYNYPSELLKFFKNLPKGSYNIDWIQAKFEKSKRLTPHLLEQEILGLSQSAKMNGVDYYPGSLRCYDDRGMIMDVLDIKNDMQHTRLIPYEQVGLIIPWGKNYAIHPHAPNYWQGEQRDLPAFSTQLFHYIFNMESKRMRNDVFRNFTNDMPGEIYIGMASSAADEIADFVAKHDNFVHKPVCSHSGIGIGYLSQDEAKGLVEQEREVEPFHEEIKEKIRLANKYGIAPEEGKFQGYFFTTEGRSRFRMDDLGVYTLQERLEARPFRSFQTGREHTGTIRAQIYAGEPIGVMHRLSEQEYDGSQQVITDLHHKTFWERVDDGLEKRIVDFLVPIYDKVEAFLDKEIKK